MTDQFKYPLKAAQIEMFERDGMIHLPGVLHDEWVERYREAADRAPALKQLGERNYGRRRLWEPEYFMRMRVREKDDIFKHICTASSVPVIAAQLLRSDKINLLYDHMFTIEPGSRDRTPWHHDLPYWPLRGQQAATVWLALDKISKENGAIQLVRVSHRWGKRFQPLTAASDDELAHERFDSDLEDGFAPIPDFDSQRDNYEILSFDVQPGDAIAFHSLAVHVPYPNTSDRPRRAYAVRFTGSQVRYYDGPVRNPYIVTPSLKTGDLLDSDQYPVVFDARAS